MALPLGHDGHRRQDQRGQFLLTHCHIETAQQDVPDNTAFILCHERGGDEAVGAQAVDEFRFLWAAEGPVIELRDGFVIGRRFRADTGAHRIGHAGFSR